MEPFILFTFKSSVCLSAGYLLYFLLFRNETLFRVRRFILLAVVFLSLVIPLVKLQVDPAGVSLPVQRLEAAFETPAPVIASATRPFPTAGIQPMSNRPGIITILYLAGAVLQLLLISFSLLRVILLLWNSKRLSYRGYRLVLVSSDLVPFCFGRRIFLSENDFRDHSREVILHEQAHLDQMHSLDLFIAGLYVVMTWYNPISWLMRRELKQNHEFEADRKVLSKGVDESDYQLLLVRRVAGETRFQLASQFNYSNIKTRIAMMNKTKSNPAAT
ncbi:MAG: M56 family metallopeptidase [Bacteroidota bacterium]